MKKQVLLFTLLSVLAYSKGFVAAQTSYNTSSEFLKGNSIWAFSEKAGLDFNSGTAVSILSEMTSGNGALAEGAASVCDRNTGELLFYTNGQTIWNVNHQRMPNGDSLYGNGAGVTGASLSTRQGVVIVPFIDNPDKYYVFSLGGVDEASVIGHHDPRTFINDNGDTVSGSLFYSIVDMTLDSGRGDVVMKNVFLDTSALSEAMIAIPGTCNNIWLLVHSAGPPLSDNPPHYKAYEITSSGINTTPTLSPGKVNAMAGWMTISPDRSTIALDGGGLKLFFANTPNMGLEIGKFNIQDGTVDQVVALKSYDDSLGGVTIGSGCVFSPNNQYLYFHNGNLLGNSYLTQCNVSSFDSATIINSQVHIASTGGGNLPEYLAPAVTGFRLYNDTIYLASTLNGSSPPYYISTINNPNSAGASCDYDAQSILLLPTTWPSNGTLGSETVFLPSTDTVVYAQDTLICKGWMQGVQLSPTQANGINFEWNDNSTDSVLTIDQGGTYWVNYYTEDCGSFYSDTFHITGADLPEPVITVDEMKLGVALRYYTYQWLYEGDLMPGETDSVLYVEVNGDYQVIVTNEQGCIDTSDVYPVNNASIESLGDLAAQIQVWPNPVQEKVFVNAPVSVQLSLSSISGKLIYQPSRSHSLSMRELAAGMYLLRISNNDGRLIKVEKLIKAKE